ncbi:hypothetical protein RCH09_003806 [Actimicrobium sp. GrIS 1.19]|uniref:DUF3761 domain-containing protein n=1 Tax=Actimicrobium sp. GrIS 1.19 TaxID=3071708 RepID=UPI002DFA2B4E|nr:hypothetical protein [Actimicrobium sp. GrIS 1.19]
MKTLFIAASMVTTLLTSVIASAQAPAAAPAGSTAECKDGTYYSGAAKSGACSGHKGIKEWYGAKDAAAAPAAASPAPASKVVPAPAAAAAPAKTATPAPATPAAAGGGPGQVWVNSSSKVYHCQNTKYYGKTKAGSYMTEADAKAKGFHADHGKACS